MASLDEVIEGTENQVIRRKAKRMNGLAAHVVEQKPAHDILDSHPRTSERPSFFERLKQMPDEEWDRHTLYIYRRWPRISKSDTPHYIGTVRQAIDEPWLLENYGSGRYTLRLNNARKTIDSFVAEVHDLNRPPKLDPAELTDAPENTRYHELWPTQKPSTASAPAFPGSPDSAAVAGLTKLLGQVIEKQSAGQADRTKDVLIEWALAQTSKKDEANGPAQIATLLKELRTLMPAAQPTPPQPDPLALIDRLLTVTEKLRPQPATKEDEFERLGKMLELVDRLRPPGAASAAAGETGWDRAMQVAQALTPLIQPVGNLLSLGAAKWFGLQPQTGMQRPLHPARVPHQADAEVIAVQPQVAGRADAPALQQTSVIDPAVQQLAGFLPQLAGPIVMFINAGRTGAEFADYFCEGYGEMIYAQVTQLSKEQILQAMSLTEGLAPLLVQIPAKIAQFTDEFLNAERTPDDPEEDLSNKQEPPAEAA